MNDLIRHGSHPLNEWLNSGDVSWHYIYKTHQETKNCSDLVGDEWRYWNAEAPVFISTQTGTGKTTFIETVLLRNVLTNNRHYRQHRKMLFAINRTALRRQVIYHFSKLIIQYTGDASFSSQLNYYTDEGIDKHLRKLGDIYIVTYQHLASSDGQKLLQEHDFEYVILDEAHFFTMDALFNADTGAILNNIVHHCNTAIRVYLSATIETVLEPILRTEFDEWHERRNLPHTPHDDILPFTPEGRYPSTWTGMMQLFEQQSERFSFIYYDLERNYEHVKTQAYQPDELENILTAASGRCLVFVESKEDGRALKKKLEAKKTDWTVVFLTSESKGTAEFGDLVKNESLNADVIISTAVIDNGINIKDEKISDIIIVPFDRTEFLQMLGRLRKDIDRETLRVWMPSRTEAELETLLKAELRKLIDRLSLNGLSRETKDTLMGTYLRQKDGFSVNAVEGLYYSSLSVYPLLESIQRITRILRNIHPDFSLNLEDSVYQSRVFKAFYDAVDGKLPMADAICRTLLGLHVFGEKEYLESQITWKKTNWEDDSFLYIIYSMRLKDLEESLKCRSQGDENPLDCHTPQPLDRHPMLSDEELKEQLRRQATLLNRFGKSQSALEEALYWLELDPPEHPAPPPTFNDEKTVEDALHEISITEEELHSVVDSSNICRDEKFLEAHCFQKDSVATVGKNLDMKSIAFDKLYSVYVQQHGGDVTLTKMMNATKKYPLSISSNFYIITSVMNSKKKTLYAIVRKNLNASE